MKISELVNLLVALIDSGEAEVVIRDLNGLDWVFEAADLLVEGNRLVLNSEGLNRFSWNRVP